MKYVVEKMYRLPDAGTLKAFADVCVNDVMVIKGVRVLKGKKGLFISLPQEKGKDNKWYDQIVMKTADEYDMLVNAMLVHYSNQEATK